MDDLDGSQRPRRIVLDVASARQPTEQRGSRKRRRRRNKKKSQTQHPFHAEMVQPPYGFVGKEPFGRPSSDDERDDMYVGEVVKGIPMELNPLVQAAMSYGRKTHALGAMRAVEVLVSIAARLKASNLVGDPTIQRVILDAEQESTRIMSSMGTAYNEGDEAIA